MSKGNAKAAALTFDNVGFKIEHSQWEAIIATANAQGVGIAEFFRNAAGEAVVKAGLYQFPEVEGAYKRGRRPKG